MPADFDVLYEAPSRCCSEGLHWEWNEEMLQFEAECGCMKRYHLRPSTGEIQLDSEEFEYDAE